jgi:hypothetical protein
VIHVNTRGQTRAGHSMGEGLTDALDVAHSGRKECKAEINATVHSEAGTNFIIQALGVDVQKQT